MEPAIEPLTPKQPRLLQLFSDVKVIGQGGYGVVVKARSSLDDHQYAIKCVEITSSESEAAMREVVAHSRLRHKNIVKFHSVWLEKLPDEYCFHDDPHKKGKGFERVFLRNGSKSSTESSEVSDSDETSVDSESSSPSLAATGNHSHNTSQSNCSIIFADNSDSVGNEKSMSSQNEETEENSDSVGNDKSMSSQNEDSEEKLWDNSKEDGLQSSLEPSTNALCLWLFIQMELCDQDLRTYLDNRKTCNKREAMRIFNDVCDGLLYIHKSKFIHRDIMPKNLFISSTGAVKVGDLGLAKYFRSRDPELRTHTRDVGAALYQSPEKRAGNTYDTKSDVYSMGMILFELLYEMKTHSERIDKQTKAQDGLLPKDFVGPERDLVEKMLSHQPHDRPTLTEVLQHLQAEDYGGCGEFSLAQLVQDRSQNLLEEELEKCKKSEDIERLLRTNLAAAIHIQTGDCDQAMICTEQVLQKDEWNIHALRNKKLICSQFECAESMDTKLKEAEAQKGQVLKARIEYSYCITILDSQSYGKSISSFQSVCQDPDFDSIPLDDRLLASWLYVKTLIRALSEKSRDTHKFTKHKLIPDTLIHLHKLASASDPFLLMQRWLWTAEVLTKCKHEFCSSNWQNAYRSQLGELPSISDCLLEAEKHCDQTKNAKGFARLGNLYFQLLSSNESRENIYDKIESLLKSALAIDGKNILALWNMANLYREKWLYSYIQENADFLNSKLEQAGGLFKDAKHYLQRKPVVDLSSSRNQFLTEQRSVLEKLLEVTPTNLSARLQQARVFFTQNEAFTDVERMFEGIIEQGEIYDPRISCDAYELWGLCCVEKGHLKKAEKLLFRVLHESVGKGRKYLLAYEELNAILQAPGNQESEETEMKLELAAACVTDYQGLNSIDCCIRFLTTDEYTKAQAVAESLFQTRRMDCTQFVAICLYAARMDSNPIRRYYFSIRVLHLCFQQNENVGIPDLLIIHSEDRAVQVHTSIESMNELLSIKAICQCQLSTFHDLQETQKAAKQIVILFTRDFRMPSEWRDTWQREDIDGVMFMSNFNSLPLVVFYASDDQFEVSPRLRTIKVKDEQMVMDECLQELAIDLSRTIFGVKPVGKSELIESLMGSP